MESKEEIARILHETYETCAKAVGWKTQKKCRVSFKDLPKDNKLVMLKMAGLVQKMIKEELYIQLKSLSQHQQKYLCTRGRRTLSNNILLFGI